MKVIVDDEMFATPLATHTETSMRNTHLGIQKANTTSILKSDAIKALLQQNKQRRISSIDIKAHFNPKSSYYSKMSPYLVQSAASSLGKENTDFLFGTNGAGAQKLLCYTYAEVNPFSLKGGEHDSKDNSKGGSVIEEERNRSFSSSSDPEDGVAMMGQLLEPSQR
jgi:hypothetical protein